MASRTPSSGSFALSFARAGALLLAAVLAPRAAVAAAGPADPPASARDPANEPPVERAEPAESAAPAPKEGAPAQPAAPEEGSIPASEDAPTGTPAPAPAPTEGGASDADAPVEGPEPEGGSRTGDPTDPDYASAKDAGSAVSGAEVEDRQTSTEHLGGREEKKPAKSISHLKTAILGVAVSEGLNFITAGDKFCGQFTDTRQDPDGRSPFCSGRTPISIDAWVGYGAADRVDIIVAGRFNLEDRDWDASSCPADQPYCADGKGLFVTKRAIGILPGVRLYGKQFDSKFKLGGIVQIHYMHEDFTEYRDRPTSPLETQQGGEDVDNEKNEGGVGDNYLGLRGGAVIQIDPHHNFGIVIIPALMPGFRPKDRPDVDAGWFEFGAELSIGLEARFP